jgi:hypothetical protein
MAGSTSKMNRRINEERPFYLLPGFMGFSFLKQRHRF